LGKELLILSILDLPLWETLTFSSPCNLDWVHFGWLIAVLMKFLGQSCWPTHGGMRPCFIVRMLEDKNV
jgi:hypothetical protein